MRKNTTRGLYFLLCLLSIFTSLFVTAAELLPAEQAFVVQTSIDKQHNMDIYWQIAPGYYLYKDQFKLINADNNSILPTDLPAGTNIVDQALGNYTVYSQQVNITIPVTDELINNSLLLSYQGCAENGFCYAPVTKQIYISPDYKVQINNADISNFNTSSDTDQLAENIKNNSLPTTMAIFLVLGLLLAFTPCVLPMLPLVLNLIIGAKDTSRRKAFVLSSLYVLGMASSYALAGMLAGMLGATIQIWMQQSIILIPLCCLLIVLALGQFELINISLPHFNRRLHNWGQQQLQGSLLGALVLGILSALIVSPCITPPLIGVLTYIGQNGSPIIGAITLFTLGLGMGAPLIIVALLSSLILPKAGPWMSLIKTASGIALLGLTIWILERVIPMEMVLILWGILCILTALLLRKQNKIIKFIAIIIALYGVFLIADAISKKYAFISYNKPTWNLVTSKKQLEEFLNVANLDQKNTLLEFYADWCASCKKIELGVFANQKVRTNLDKFMLLRVDLTNTTEDEKQLLADLQIYGPPAILFFNINGEEVKSKRLVGDVSVDQMLEFLGK